MIKIQIIGNLGKDCITNQVNGKNVMNFSVCHTEKFKDAQGNMKEKSTWCECAYWTDRTALAPYLKKGTQVYVEGTPEVREFKKNDGTTGGSLSVRVSTVQLLGQKAEGNSQPQQQERPLSPHEQDVQRWNTPSSGGNMPDNSDLPF